MGAQQSATAFVKGLSADRCFMLLLGAASGTAPDAIVGAGVGAGTGEGSRPTSTGGPMAEGDGDGA